MQNVIILFFVASSLFIKPLLVDPSPIIIMQRTACYGTCPNYKITIYDNGKTLYEGFNFVDKIGLFQTYISKNDIINIIKNINEINYFDLDDIYNTPVTDIPSVILTVSIDKKSHKVIDRFSGPQSLKKIHKLIDEIINNATEWDSVIK